MTAALPARPIEDMDAAAPVSLARRFLAERDRPGNQSDQRACETIRLLLRHMRDSVSAAVAGPLAFDLQLVADMLRHPHKYRGDVVAMQAALVAGCLLPDTPMADPPLAQSLRRLHQDDGV